MDRLNNILTYGGDPTTGYPLSPEIINVLDGHCQYINAILDGLALPSGTCVFLNYDSPAVADGAKYISNAMVFVLPPTGTGSITGGYKRGEIHILENITGVTAAELINGIVQRSIQIAVQQQGVVSDPSGDGSTNYQQWNDVIRVKRARIVPASSGINGYPAYTFTTLRHLLNMNESSYLYTINQSTGLRIDNCHNNIFRIKGNRLEIQLCMTTDSDISGGAGKVVPISGSLGLPIANVYYLSCHTQNDIPCVAKLQSNTLYLLIDGSGGMPAGSKIYINGTILIN